MSKISVLGVREFLFQLVVRPLMLVVWLCVFWGTLELAWWTWSLLFHGFAETVARVRPADGDGWPAIANVGLAFLALVVWISTWFLWRTRRAAVDRSE